MLPIVTREQWGAVHPAGFRPAPLPALETWLHHSVTVAPDLVPPFTDEDAAMRQLEKIGQQKFGGGVSYTYAVMPTGRVYEGHGVDREGAHTAGRNSTARAIVLVGNYDVDEPTDEQLESTALLLVDGWLAGYWETPYLAGGHREVPGASTVCPGRHALACIDRINQRARVIASAAINQNIDQEDDMPLTDADATLVAGKVYAMLINGRREVNLTALLRVAKAVDHRVDVMDDATASTLAAIDDKLDDLLRLLAGAPRAATTTPARLLSVAEHDLPDDEPASGGHRLSI